MEINKRKNNYHRGEKKKLRQLAFRVNESEYNKIVDLAWQHADGNISYLVRSVFFKWLDGELKK